MPARKKKRVHKASPKTPSRIKKRRGKGKARSHAHHHPELIGLGLAGLGVFLAAILWFGFSGGPVADLARGAIGAAAYLMPVVLVPLGALMIAKSALVDVRPFRLGLVVALTGLLLTLGHAHGGLAGDGLARLVALGLGSSGATILGVLLVIAGVLFLTGASLGAILRRSGGAMRAAHTRVAERRERLAREPAAAPALDPPSWHEPPIDVKQDYPDLVSDSVSAPAPLLFNRDPDPYDAQTNETQETLFDVGKPVVEYKLPDRALLNVSKPGTGPNAEANARVAEALVTCLAHFGVDATVIGQIAGPRVTRYELQLAPGTKVGKVANLKDDLSYALATTEIRILAPIPGKQAVGVEVPNLSPNLVTLGDIYDDLPATASPLSVWLGKDISGASVWADLARMPHILIAGTTGSGKSGCINAILTSILLRATPDEARMILIDPKKIELNYYESIPHLLTPVVSSPKEAAAVLLNVVTEMERRYERLSQVRARNLPEANRAFRKRGEEELPYLLVVIDELADLMMVSPQGVEDCDHPPRAEVARGRHPSRACDAASVGRRDHRHDQGERAVADRLRGLVADGLARHPRRERRRKPPRAGRHALQAARHLAAATCPGRLRDRGRGRARRRAGPRPARAGDRRDASSRPRWCLPTTPTPTTASSTRTKIRCSTRRSRSS